MPQTLPGYEVTEDMKSLSTKKREVSNLVDTSAKD